MTVRATLPPLWQDHPNQFIRFADIHPPAKDVMRAFSLSDGAAGLVRSMDTGQLSDQSHSNDAHFDYAQIDPSLRLAPIRGRLPHPAPDVGYPGLTPEQRRAFSIWLSTPERKGTLAFQKLYLGYLECHLLENAEGRTAAIHELQRLLSVPTWKRCEELRQVTALAAWLDQNGPLLQQVVLDWQGPRALLGKVLAWQAALGTPLSPRQTLLLTRPFRLSGSSQVGPETEGDEGLGDHQELFESLALTLDSLTDSLQMDPLVYALQESLPSDCARNLKLPDKELPAKDLFASCDELWVPWRCVHKDLRFRLPQLDILPSLEPILRELAELIDQVLDTERSDTERVDGSRQESAGKPKTLPRQEWNLVLEFGESRASSYQFVLKQTRRMPGYRMILDENRQIIHRVTFRRKDMRQFWRIWESVQSWTSTKVYVNGEPASKAQIWPYSHVLQ